MAAGWTRISQWTRDTVKSASERSLADALPTRANPFSTRTRAPREGPSMTTSSIAGMLRPRGATRMREVPVSNTVDSSPRPICRANLARRQPLRRLQRGGGGFSRCGNGDGGAPGDAGACVPKTCVELGLTCGSNADGCGGVLDCGTCTAPAVCGGGGFSVCGGPAGAEGGTLAACVPATCSSLGVGCGTAGDGCGGTLACGTCAAPAFCGGGGFSVCGGSSAPGATPVCAPATCRSLGFNCGPAGDGCGNLLQCGACGGADVCGGGGTPGVCGHTCTGLCTQQVACAGTPTTITGRVLAGVSAWVPAGTTPDPVPNAIVYVPNGTIQPFAPGAQCTQCGADVSGDPLVSTTSAFDGTFTLTNVPVGSQIPVVVQLGRWRREVYVDVATSCAATAAGDIQPAEHRERRRHPADGDLDRIHLYSAGFGTADANG